jgi:tRNA(adenine34) deaminase
LSTHDVDEYYMSQALQLAESAFATGEVPVGALMVYDQTIIAKGYNQPITLCDPTAHAEILVLRTAARLQKNYRLIDTTLYVTLEPCLMCLGALLQARIKKLVFGAFDTSLLALEKKLAYAHAYANHKLMVQGGVLEHSCAQRLKTFFQAKRTLKVTSNL